MTSVCGGEDVGLPRLVDSLELVCTSVGEPQPGACCQVLDRPRHDDLSRVCEPHHARGDVNGDSTDGVPTQLHLSDMDSSADFETERPHLGADRLGAPHPARRAVKDREQPVPGAVDQPTAEPVEDLAREPVVTVEQLSPLPVADLGQLRGRVDEVGEEHRREDPLVSGRRLLIRGEEPHDLVGNSLVGPVERSRAICIQACAMNMRSTARRS